MYKYSCLNILAIFSPLKFQARLQVLILSHNTIAQGFVIERAWRLCYQQSRLLASKWNSAVSTKKEQTHSERSVAWRCERKREREEIIFYPGTKYTKWDKNERKDCKILICNLTDSWKAYCVWKLTSQCEERWWKGQQRFLTPASLHYIWKCSVFVLGKEMSILEQKHAIYT